MKIIKDFVTQGVTAAPPPPRVITCIAHGSATTSISGGIAPSLPLLQFAKNLWTYLDSYSKNLFGLGHGLLIEEKDFSWAGPRPAISRTV
jgi:hypothetical protein